MCVFLSIVREKELSIYRKRKIIEWMGKYRNQVLPFEIYINTLVHLACCNDSK